MRHALKALAGPTLAALTLILAVGCGKSAAVEQDLLASNTSTATAGSPTRPPSAAAATPPIQVTTTKPQRKTLRRTTEQPGHIEAFEQVDLYAKVAGYLKTLSVDIGDRVIAGQELARLWVPELEEELRQKEAWIDQARAEAKQAEAALVADKAGVAVAKAGVAGARAGREFRASEYHRHEQLFADRSIPKALLDEKRSQAAAAEASVQAAEAKVGSAEANVGKAAADVGAAHARVRVAERDRDRLKALVDYSVLRSPFAGVVTRRLVDPGAFIQESTRGAAQPLLRLVRADVVRIFVDVPETDAPLVDPGDRALVRVQALKSQPIEAKVTRSAWALDPTSRTLRAEIDLPNPAGTLRPGMYAYATIITEEHVGALTLPTTAVFTHSGKTCCAVVRDGHIRRTELTLGSNTAADVQVLSGLTGQEDVVAQGAASLADGQPVSAGASP